MAQKKYTQTQQVIDTLRKTVRNGENVGDMSETNAGDMSETKLTDR